MLKKELKGQAHGQGMGRHTEAEVIEMGVKDLRAISTFLGILTTSLKFRFPVGYLLRVVFLRYEAVFDG